VKIKICGLSRGEDVDYVNEARPDYIGFVFAESRRQISPERAAGLRERLAKGIVPVGVFSGARLEEIAALYRDGIIDIAQLHGSEDRAYVAALKEKTAALERGAIPVIKALMPGACFETGADALGSGDCVIAPNVAALAEAADFLLLDSGGGSGRVFDWGLARPLLDRLPRRPWFLAGGIGLHNLAEALALGVCGALRHPTPENAQKRVFYSANSPKEPPFGVDVSSGAETEGRKDREKILKLTELFRQIAQDGKIGYDEV
jgi:phosphoribosylanthranilate isomerase